MSGTIPGPLLMGVIFDGTCMLWQNDCGATAGAAETTTGSCMFYDNSDLSLGFLLLCGSVSAVSLASIVVGAVCYRAPAAMDAVVVTVYADDAVDETTKLSAGSTRFQTDLV